jgi:hypothetical protein
VTRTSNEEGIFNFNALPADHFTLVVEMQGFQKKVLNDLQLIPEQAIRQCLSRADPGYGNRE